MEDAGGQMEALSGHQQVGARVPEDQVAVPLNQVGQQQLLLALANDVGMHAEERLRVGAQVDALGEVVRFLFGVPSDFGRVARSLVDVVGDAGAEVVDLRQAPQRVPMSCRVLLAENEWSSNLDGLFESHAGAAIEPEVAQALVRRADLVVGSGGRAQPPLRDEAPFAYGGLFLAEAQTEAGRQEAAGHPSRIAAEDTTPVCESRLHESQPVVCC